MSAIMRFKASISKLNLMHNKPHNRFDIIQHTGFGEWYYTADRERTVGQLEWYTVHVFHVAWSMITLKLHSCRLSLVIMGHQLHETLPGLYTRDSLCFCPLYLTGSDIMQRLAMWLCVSSTIVSSTGYKHKNHTYAPLNLEYSPTPSFTNKSLYATHADSAGFLVPDINNSGLSVWWSWRPHRGPCKQLGCVYVFLVNMDPFYPPPPFYCTYSCTMGNLSKSP